MRDEDSLHDEEKQHVTNDSKTGKPFLNWLNSSNEPAQVDSDVTENSLDRRSYMRLAGSTAAAAAVMGGAASTTAAAGTDDESGETLDVTADPYNASGDGSTNDYEAIHAALRDASPGDTVYVPSGTYNVYASGTLFNFNEYAEPITLEGDGEDTVIRAHRALSGPMVRTDGQEVTIRNLVFDGRRGEFGNYGEHGIVIWTRTSTYNGVLVENCLIENFPENGITAWGRNTQIRWCTVRNNGLHGIGMRDDEANQPGWEVEHCLVERNAQNHSGFYNIDAATGHIRIRDTVMRESGGGATKTSNGGHVDVRYERCRIVDNSATAYQSTAGDFGTVVFEDCVADNNGRVRASNLDYHVEGHLVVKNSNESGLAVSNGAELVGADEISAVDNAGEGLAGNPGTVSVYNHAGNGGGPGGSGYSIDTTTSDPQTDLDNVPTADEVGAWAKDDSDEADDDDDADETVDPTVDDYADPETGLVETDGLLDAIADWQGGDTETDLLLDVIADWQSGKPV